MYLVTNLVVNLPTFLPNILSKYEQQQRLNDNFYSILVDKR